MEREETDYVDSVTLVGKDMYNTKGYLICGYLNRDGYPCKRIGKKCPFHFEAVEKEKKKPEYEDEVVENISSRVELKIRTEVPVSTIQWSKEEHLRFLEGLKTFGRGNWKSISRVVGTKNVSQVQSHSQKYHSRKKQKRKKKRSIFDLTIEELRKEVQEGDRKVQILLPFTSPVSSIPPTVTKGIQALNLNPRPIPNNFPPPLQFQRVLLPDGNGRGRELVNPQYSFQGRIPNAQPNQPLQAVPRAAYSPNFQGSETQPQLFPPPQKPPSLDIAGQKVMFPFPVTVTEGDEKKKRGEIPKLAIENFFREQVMKEIGEEKKYQQIQIQQQQQLLQKRRMYQLQLQVQHQQQTAQQSGMNILRDSLYEHNIGVNPLVYGTEVTVPVDLQYHQQIENTNQNVKRSSGTTISKGKKNKKGRKRKRDNEEPSFDDSQDPKERKKRKLE